MEKYNSQSPYPYGTPYVYPPVPPANQPYPPPQSSGAYSPYPYPQFHYYPYSYPTPQHSAGFNYAYPPRIPTTPQASSNSGYQQAALEYGYPTPPPQSHHPGVVPYPYSSYYMYRPPTPPPSSSPQPSLQHQGSFKYGSSSPQPTLQNQASFKYGPSTPQPTLQNQSSFKYGPSTPQRTLQNQSSFKYGPSTPQRTLQNQSSFKYGPSTPQPTLQNQSSFKYGSSSPQPSLQQQASFKYGSSTPQPSLQQQCSFKYGPSTPQSTLQNQQGHHFQQPVPQQQALQGQPMRGNEFRGLQRQHSTLSTCSSVSNYDHGIDSTSASSSANPSMDDLTNMHLSDNRPPGPGPYASPGTIYAYPNSSFSRLESSSVSRAESTSHHRPSYSNTFVETGYNKSLQLMPFTPKGAPKVLLIHGNLGIWVYEAKNLPNMDLFHKTIGDMFNKLPGNMSTKIEGHMNRKITSDPYVTITLSGATVGRTYVISNDENPTWMQHFKVPVAHHAAEVLFIVKDNDVVGSQLIGTVAIPVENIYGGGKVEGFFPILTSNGKPCKTGAVLSLSIQYTPMEQLSIYHYGVGAGPEYTGVPGTYFPLRKGGTVTLYQDAHVPDGGLPNLKLECGMQYVHGKCWHDIFNALRNARRLIYITGWSVWHKVKLVRDDSSAEGCTLGELLKSKSQEGVRVLLLIWDDPTSRKILGYKTDGVMATHDEETRRFFKHSSVHVLLCPRVAGKRHSWMKQREVGVIYTHHQKTVIVDTEAANNRRSITAFVGGLDLCDGRYDTPGHPIFRTLQTVHAADYHNPTFAGNVSGCPREPWHDMHCKIVGPAAYDILTNFEERWLKAAKPRGIKKLKKSYDDALLRLDRMPEILGVSDAPSINAADPEGWHVQIFRSIDSNSVKGFPKDPKRATMKQNLVCGKNLLIDMSIHTAYVKAIRSAQHYIYIENQYFIGSSYNWSQYKDVGANNLIPFEIALKIAAKIRAHERFAAYIIIPMWPEGNPTGAATQRILFWQHKTMQMMYETIYKALAEVGLEDAFSPQDYLNFYCLGNREALSESDASSNDTNWPANSPQALSRKNRRFMIYVHSKGMIVDDENVIIGSANINQRSLEGTRDTEIAMGAYQPNYTWARKRSNPQGQIYGYRMSLWAEHLGVVEDCFKRPESLECVRRVRSMGEANWHQFAADEVTEMRGHLLKYPVDVDRKGKVKPLSGCPIFPDVGGNIVGSFLAIQENLTI
ncbi:PREDICTED: phospholipase D gamma 1-like isoform X3 [Ipomoea nil]|uniref:phospholipase D gamma 1-like isoform X3 n=1 Tax=Ipomoea nil TaxID=35883 RepID=UPI00090168C7|nr:PREDICTED: phospholipase D gamma 1-like isoform X3 [Ipomoea nil]